jgi:transcriptional regulator with XRE-family HTH domain
MGATPIESTNMETPTNRNSREEAMERTKLAERLREAREYLGFSQDQVAQHLGISRSALSNIETGQRKVEAVELKRLAALYKRPQTHFTGELGPPGEPLPPDVEHLARTASTMTPKDREELTRFADFLRSRTQSGGSGSAGGK